MRWGMARRESPAAGAQARAAASDARSSKREVEFLEERVDRLTLICMAMWSLLRERTDLTEEDLDARVNEIDLQDGDLDGKLRKPKAVLCQACGRKMARRHTTCLYCGAPRTGETAFDKAL